MTNHRAVRETFDETIDRVAAALTAVPADPRLVGRIVQRLHETHAAGRLVPAAVALTATVIVITALGIGEGPIDPPVVSVPVTPLAIAPAPPDMAGVRDVVFEPAIRRVARRRAGTPIRPEEESPVPQIELLRAPSGIALDDLNTDLLTIAPVTVAPLDLASLEDVTISDQPPKE